MKKYFDFTLTGKKFLPIWLIFYILIIVPYVIYMIMMRDTAEPENTQLFAQLMIFGVMIVGYLIYFFIIKITIEHVNFNNSQLNFNGKFLTYLGKILLGLLLSIITLFIYLPWFIRDITRFFVNKSSLDGEKFDFKGKGSTLFLILLLSMLIPMILLAFLGSKLLIAISPNLAHDFIRMMNESSFHKLIFQGALMIFLIPYMYLVYKWMVNVKYKGYHIKWKTKFLQSCGKILVEIFLGVITLGIYMPLAYLKLYKYFSERTIAEKDTSSLQFGYELDSKNDFLFIWGQILLTIVTLGIYYPWAYSKIGKRVLSKTYVTEIVAA